MTHTPTAAEIKAATDAIATGKLDGSEARGGFAKHTIQESLPEKPTVKDGFAVLGNLKVQADKYDLFRQAMLHEAKNPEMAALIERLERGPNGVTVTMNDTANNSHGRNADGSSRVNWDPSAMHIAANGAKRSPATRLAHELDHADEWTHNPQRMLIHRACIDDKFGNLEERRVITGTERRNVASIGEGRREDHDAGKGNFNVKSPTSIEPVLKQTRDGVTTELHDGYTQNGAITLSGNKIVQDIGHGKTVAYDANQFVGMVGRDAVVTALRDHKPMTVGVTGGEFKMTEHREIDRGTGHGGR